MSMRSSVAFVIAVVQESVSARLQGSIPNRSRIDTNLPLGIRFGSFVTFEPTPFLLQEGSRIGAPTKPLEVVSYDTFDYGGNLVYRFYFRDSKYFLQVMRSSSGSLIEGELKIFRNHLETNPVTQEDWDFWLQQGFGMIGLKNVDDSDGKTFTHLLIDGDTPWMSPIVSQSTLYLDLYGDRRETEELIWAPYYRTINEGENPCEFVLFTAVKKKEGPQIVEAWVTVDMGMLLEPHHITVQ